MKYLILLLLPLSTFAQSTRLLNNLDSSYVAKNAIIASFPDSTFYESKKGEKRIDLQKIDQELLNAALYFAINRARKKRNRTELEYVPDLEFAAFNCTQYYTKSKFKSPKRGRAKFEKVLYLLSLKSKRDQHLISTNVAYTSLLDISKRKKIKKRKNGKGHYEWFFLNALKEEVLIPLLSYNDFAAKVVEILSKGSNKKFFYSDSFETMGCYIQLDKNTVLSSKGPKVKVIQIVGGKRLKVGEG